MDNFYKSNPIKSPFPGSQKACLALRSSLNLKNILFFTCFLFLAVLNPFTSFSQNYQQISLTGFNHDLVANGPNLVASASTSTKMDVQGNVMYVKGYQGCAGNLNYGLPVNGSITSVANSALTYQMAPFTQNNALFLTSSGTQTLQFGTSGSYDLISILATSSEGSSSFTATLNFSDGSSSTYSFFVPDWYNGSPYAITNFGRVRYSSCGTDEGPGNPRFYDNVITLNAADKQKLLKSVSFNKGGSGYTSIFAITGRTVVNAPSTPLNPFANNITASGFSANWSAVTGATSYVLDVSTSSNFSTFVSGYNNQNVGNITTVNIPAGNGTYYFRVRSVNAVGQSLSSTTATATINATPAGALNFDGVNDYVTINNPFTAFGKELTVEWNANIDPSSPIGSGIGQSLPNSDGQNSLVWLMHYYPEVQKIQFYISDNGAWKHAEAVVPTGWHKFTGVASGTSIKIYMDGNLISTSPDVVNTGILNVPNSVIHLGKDSRYAGGRFMKGGIDEVRIWSRALCIGEIQNNLAGELSGSQDGLQEYYKFNQGFVNGNNAGNTTLTDFSGNNRTGNLINFALNGSTSNWIEGAVSGTAPAFDPPTASFTAGGSLNFCPNGSVTFTANSGDGYAYQWIKNGSPIEGANGVSYSATTSGSYNVIITKNGCTASAEAQQVVVEDLIAPTVSTLQDVILDLGSNCSIVVPDYRSQLSISDNCTQNNSLIVTQSPAPGTVSTGAGQLTVSFSVKDFSGNEKTSSFTLIKRDNIAPTVAAKNFTLYLQANGTGTLTTSNVDNNSSDGCSPVALTFSNTGKICAIANEGGTLSLSAPQGAVITSIDFASYGNATGDCGNFSLGYCNSTLSQSRVESAFLGKNSGSISATNGTFGDPCYGTVKRLVVQATYTIPGISANGESISFSCNQSGDNTVTLIGTDASGNAAATTAIVTVIDSVKPIAIAQNVTVQLNASGSGSTTATLVNNGSSDACGIQSIELSKTDFDCSNVGENTVTLTVTDKNGNISTANATVTVEDNIAPVALTKNVTVQLNASGSGSTTAALVNNGSNDACEILSIVLSKTDFDCSNVGENTVTLTVTDKNGNVSTANATVTVEDNIAPVALTKNVTVQLNASGSGSSTAALVDNGSSDACGILSMVLSKSDFDCSNVGVNTVTLTVTDINGNTAYATATVTVEDNIAPIALAKNISVTLVNGSATITAASIDNGSNDACGIQSLAIDKSSFDCSNLGNNTVVLTVTDKNGNVSSATAIVNVIGVKPVAAIAISRADHTFTGLDSKTIALGYGAQSLTLTASNSTSASNATTYAWYPSEGLSNANIANPVFTPTSAGTYTYNVIATNEFGCTASSSVTITVLDVRCGNKNDKVLVCQKTGSAKNPWVQICISANAVDAHLKKGSTLGTCGSTTSNTLAALSTTDAVALSGNLLVSNKNTLSAYPNPFVNQTTVAFTLVNDAAQVSLDLYDLKGVRIANIYSGKAEALKEYSFVFRKSVPAGSYFFRLTGSGNALNFKVIVAQ